MENYAIFVDSSADIAPSFLKQQDIHILAMSYVIGGEQCEYSKAENEANLRQFYARQRNGEVCQTSQASPQQFIDAFDPVLKSGRDILYISLSGGLTNTHDSIYLVKTELLEQYPDTHIYEIDSLSATGGIGLLAEAAVKLRVLAEDRE